MRFVERTIFGEMFIRVGESNEARFRVETFFVETANSPLTGLFEFAAGAFAAWYFYADAGFRVRFFKDETVVPGVTPGTISR
jgi:hypothetical protein